MFAVRPFLSSALNDAKKLKMEGTINHYAEQIPLFKFNEELYSEHFCSNYFLIRRLIIMRENKKQKVPLLLAKSRY